MMRDTQSRPSPPLYSGRRCRSRGFTLIEVMLAIGIMLIGLVGIVSMQRISVDSNRHAKNLAMANRIAQSAMEMLIADSLAWDAQSLLSNTVYLTNVTDVNPGPWLTFDSNTGVISYDALGDRLVGTSAGSVYCINYRVNPMMVLPIQPNDPPPVENGNLILMRAEVRAYWRRKDFATSEGNAHPLDAVGYCGLENAPDAESGHHIVRLPSAIARQLQ